jgi:para-nitrobenzyl esterase
MSFRSAAGRAGVWGLLALGSLLGACGEAPQDGAVAPGAAAAAAAFREPVMLDSGLVGNSVESSPGVRVFKGIPFAAPPVGELRWAAPEPVAKWDGVRDASQFGNVCIQPDGAARGPKGMNIAVAPGSPPMSEDCLYLNVWTGADAATERRPVMVYFFGGAFTEGAGSIPLYDGDALAQKGAVVVTMNYRLGPYGFFAHPALTADSPHQASGNYGLADMVASLRWVRSNIAAFGGDPSNVTVFGQSAGAMAIGSLVTSPETKGLFHRAIGQSGSWMGLGPAPAMAMRARAEEGSKGLADAAGVTTVEQLRAMSAADVTAMLGRGAGMIVDGWIIPEDPSAVFAAGRQNPVDVLVGSNRDDLSFAPQNATPEQFEQRTRARWGDLADQFLNLYPHATNEEASKSQADSANDGAFWHMRLFADYQKKQGRQAWLFYFAQNPPGPEGEPPLAAAHASEIPYAFNNLGKPALFPDPSEPALSVASAPDRKVADQMSSYWVNFARGGDPNGAGLPMWQAHQVGASERAIILDAEPSSEQLPAKPRLELFDKLYAQMQL